MASVAWEMTFGGATTTLNCVHGRCNSQWTRVPPTQEERLANNESTIYLGNSGAYMPFKHLDSFQNGYQRWMNVKSQRVCFIRPTPTHVIGVHCGYEVKADRQVELSAYTLLNRELVWTKAFDADLSLAGHEIHHHVRTSLLKSKRIHTSQRLTIIETESNSPINFNTKYINPSKGFTVSHRVRGKTPLSCMPILRKLKHKSLVQQ